MASRKIEITLGLFSVQMSMESAIYRPPTLSNFCVGQPGHDDHDPLPVRAPSKCDTCGEISDRTALRKGQKSGKSITLVDTSALAEKREEFTANYAGELKLVPHPAAPFLAATGPGDTLAFLTPADAGHEDRYQLMVSVMEKHPELVFAGLYTPASASPTTHLFTVQARDGVLLLQKRVREQALKPIPSIGGAADEKHLAVLDGWVEMFTEDYDPTAYEDGYALALEQMIAEGESLALKPGAGVTSSSTDDMIARISEMVAAKKKPARKAPAKKAAKKPAARRTKAA